jgi:hypothetical protein
MWEGASEKCGLTDVVAKLNSPRLVPILSRESISI